MKRWRLKVFERDNYKCVLCLRTRKYGDRVILHADHYPKTFALILKENNIKTFEEAKKFNNLWDPFLGRTLCRECHLKTETHGRNTK
jgi:5-methylcytosine-specific restriction endonuclease McrA